MSEKGSSWVIGTRGSALALRQANRVRDRLAQLYPDQRWEIRPIRTEGDIRKDVSLLKIGGQGVFVKALEDALLNGEVDLAVHSLKDVPTLIPVGLFIAAYLERDDPRDALVTSAGDSLETLPTGARVGTGSLRRRTQLLALRSDLKTTDIRGNVDTRLRKLEEGLYDGVVLAVAGLERLGREEAITEVLSTEIMVPAVGQGIIAVETRSEDGVGSLVDTLNHTPTEVAARAERACLAQLGGGCAVPIAAHARVTGNRVDLVGVVGDREGRRLVRRRVEGRSDDPETVGAHLAEALRSDGAEEILRQVRAGS